MKDLDLTNIEFINAIEFAEETNKSVFLTGKAGTGKTTFLKYLKENSQKSMVVLAPTGVAAINAGGTTINSFFHLPFGPFVPNDQRLNTSSLGSDNNETIYDTFRYGQNKKDVLNRLELLIIDEVSMIRADTLDVINKILKVFRKKPYLPFGGVQIILIGDTYQLPPVVKEQDGQILSEFYSSEFFFASQAWSELNPIHIELKKIYRQKDQKFIDILNRIRKKELLPSDIELLNSKLNPSFNGFQEGYITLSTHRSKVDQINASNLDKLEGEEFQFEGLVKGEFPDGAKPTEHILTLKEGAQIMFVKNDSSEMKEFYNGKLGVVSSIEGEVIKVLDDENNEIELKRALWENFQYTYNKEKGRVEQVLQGSFEQFPVKLAWAITVHKSQGLTFDKAIVDLAGSFTSGQVYVALSRCTSLDHLVLKSRISENSIKVAPKVLEFGDSIASEEEVKEKMVDAKADHLYQKARIAFEKRNIEDAIELFKDAVELRNDINKPDFKRYLIVHFNKLNSSKNILINSLISKVHIRKSKNRIAQNNKEIDSNEISKEKSDLIKKYIEMAMDYCNVGDYGRAIIFYEQAIRYDPNNYEAYKNKAFCRKKLDDYIGAIADYNKAMELYPESDDFYWMRAFCKKTITDFSGAVDDYTKAIKIDSKKDSFFRNRAFCYKNLKKYDKAIEDCNKSIELNPEDSHSYEIKAECKYNLKDYEAAIKDYDKSIQLSKLINGYNTKAFRNRTKCKLKIKDYKGVISDYNRIVKIFKYEGEPLIKRAYCREMLQDYEGAILDYTKAIKLNDFEFYVFWHRAYCREKIKDYTGARTDLKEGMKRLPNYGAHHDKWKGLKKRLNVPN